MCCRSSRDSVYFPVRTGSAVSLIEKIVKEADENSAKLLLADFLVSISEYFSNFQRSYRERCARLSTVPDLYDAIDKSWDAFAQGYKVRQINSSTPDEKLDLASVCTRKFVLFVDEVEDLLRIHVRGKEEYTALRLLRLASMDSGVFLIFMDTSSKMFETIRPSLYEHPSLRSKLGDYPASCAPIFYVNPVDVCYDRKVENDVSFLLRGPSWNEAHQRAFFSMGRPMWSVERTTLDKLRLAKTKLLCVDSDRIAWEDILKDPREEVCDTRAVAILGSVSCIYLQPSAELTHNLVARGMATVLGAHKSLSSLLVSYISEPVLSEAALSYLSCISHSNGENSFWNLSNLSTVLERYLQFVYLGMFSVGERGEFAMRIYLLMARCYSHHFYSKNALFSQTVNLLDFLRSVAPANQPLVDFERQGSEKTCVKFSDWNVGFTHFVKLASPFTLKTLKKLWARGAAAALKSCEKWVDIVIPCARLVEDKLKYGVVLVQVKDYKSDFVELGQVLSVSQVPQDRIKDSKSKRWEMAGKGYSFLLYIHFDVGVTKQFYCQFTSKSNAEPAKNSPSEDEKNASEKGCPEEDWVAESDSVVPHDEVLDDFDENCGNWAKKFSTCSASLFSPSCNLTISYTVDTGENSEIPVLFCKNILLFAANLIGNKVEKDIGTNLLEVLIKMVSVNGIGQALHNTNLNLLRLMVPAVYDETKRKT
jgi:hypothetical protein